MALPELSVAVARANTTVPLPVANVCTVWSPGLTMIGATTSGTRTLTLTVAVFDVL